MGSKHNAANPTVFGLPGREYFFNEATNRQWRIRAAARDIGAFESTTKNTPVGPYVVEPRPRLSIAPAAGNTVVSWSLFARDFRLDESNLTNPVSWTPSLYGNTTNATGIFATIPMSTGNKFFRLRK